jgi:hypothetical protein
MIVFKIKISQFNFIWNNISLYSYLGLGKNKNQIYLKFKMVPNHILNL